MVVDTGVAGQMFEYKTVRIVFTAVLASGHPSSCLHAERYMYRFLALVHDDGKHPPAVVLCDVAPFELTDIAKSQATVTGEQVGVPDRFVTAWRSNQPFHFIYRQILSFPSACLGSLVAGKQVHRVCGDNTFTHGDIQGCHERALAVEYGLWFETFSFGCLISRFQIFHKGDAEVLTDFPDLCVTTVHIGENRT